MENIKNELKYGLLEYFCPACDKLYEISMIAYLKWFIDGWGNLKVICNHCNTNFEIKCGGKFKNERI